MPKLVCNTAQLQCSMGTLPAVLVVVRPTITILKLPIATVMDHEPVTNVPTFGMCNATTNPAVIAATSAAMGVHTAAPCVPNTRTPWSPGCVKLKIQNQAALHEKCTLNCVWGGVITIKNAGQTKVEAT